MGLNFYVLDQINDHMALGVHKVSASGNFESQHKNSEELNKYFVVSNRTKCQKQSFYYATERWRDIKVALLNKLAKVKSELQSQLSDELCKPITDHKSFLKSWIPRQHGRNGIWVAIQA